MSLKIHVIIVLDNAITAMTGHQENPATGRKLDHSPTTRIIIEDVAKAMGVKNVAVFNPLKEQAQFKDYLVEKLASNDITLIVLRQPCIFVLVEEVKRKAGK